MQTSSQSDAATEPGMSLPTGTAASTDVESFSGRVVILFGSSVVTTGIAIVIGFLLARVLGPSGKGDYYLATQLPVTVMVLLQLGLPQAFGYFAARGQTRGLAAKTVVLTTVLCVPALLAIVALMPILRATVLHGLDPFLVLLGIAVLPVMLNATYTTGIILARGVVGPYAAVSIGQVVVSFVLFMVVVGLLGGGLVAALWITLAVAILAPIGYFLIAARATAAVVDAAPVSYRELLSFGLPLYPGSITQYFSLRVDVYILAWVLADPSAPLGFYSMAVTMAQLLFFLPNAVSQIFFPHVAGSTREESDRQVAVVARVTLLITTTGAILLVPVATVLIHLLLPAFVDSLPAFYLLLPGVVALSLTKVLSSYVAGVGRTSAISWINIGALVLNVVANLVLIPPYGIVGAAASSLISYAASAVAFSVLAARLASGSAVDFWSPRGSDVRFAIATGIGLGRRVLRRAEIRG
jgi:O-antigen/teichoic acid export membrane protein